MGEESENVGVFVVSTIKANVCGLTFSDCVSYRQLFVALDELFLDFALNHRFSNHRRWLTVTF